MLFCVLTLTRNKSKKRIENDSIRSKRFKYQQISHIFWYEKELLLDQKITREPVQKLRRKPQTNTNPNLKVGFFLEGIIIL